MPHSSTIAARCAALNTSIAQVIPDICSFARRVRDSRHDLNAINNDLLIIRTGLGIAQDDFSKSGAKLPASLIDAVSQILDSCDDTSERLHKAFLKLSCSSAPKGDWQLFKDGLLINLRHDLNGAAIVLELALDYIALFGQQDTLDSLLRCYVSDLITASDELLKRTDKEEIHINLTARDRLPSLLQAIRLLRSCITAISREAAMASSASPQSMKRTTTPRPDSLEPSLGETRRSGRISPPQKVSSESATSKSIGTWLADVPCYEDAPPLTHSAIRRVTEETNSRRPSRSNLTPSRGTFYTDDGVSSSRTLIPSEARVRRSRSWCSNLTFLNHEKPKTKATDISRYSATMSSSDVSIIHKNITSDKIAVAKGNRKNLNVDHRVAVDRILANLPAEATAGEVEQILWEGANPMVAHPEFGYFFTRAAHEFSPDVLKVLMDFGADITRVNASSTRYYSAMHAATSGRQLDTVKYLVSLGHSIDILNNAGETPLHLAVRTPGSFKVAKYLVNMGADVNQEAHSGDTPLQATVTAPMLEGKERSMLIELLLAHGAEGEVNRDREGMRGNSKGKIVLGIT
ncbi:Nn.00g116900.m01.CDS01 [Neocucurbitaria sp. VM-36]